jgi:hypothetical protein
MSNFSKLSKLIATSALVSSFNFAALAATDGTLGETSTGSVDINLTIPDQFLVSGLNDFNFGSWDGAAGDEVLTDTLCVYGNTGSTYKITASGVADSSGTTAFAVGAAGVSDVAYEVNLNDNATNTGTDHTLTHGDEQAAVANLDTSSQNCSGGANATLTVTFPEANLQAAEAAAYGGTLSLTVAAG